MPKIAYLAHPVGDGEDRVRNIENVSKWFLWLFHNTDYAINVPWDIYVRNLSEEHRKRAMRDDLAILARCDVIILTGGRISPGMAMELLSAQLRGMEVVDLTPAGYSPTTEAISLVPDFRLMLR